MVGNTAPSTASPGDDWMMMPEGTIRTVLLQSVEYRQRIWTLLLNSRKYLASKGLLIEPNVEIPLVIREGGQISQSSIQKYEIVLSSNSTILRPDVRCRYAYPAWSAAAYSKMCSPSLRMLAKDTSKDLDGRSVFHLSSRLSYLLD